MKKNLLTILSIMIITTGIACAKTTVSPALSNVIKLYKAGNYSECYVKVDEVLKNDSSNALAYYYKAMAAAQVGKKSEAIENYKRAEALAPQGTNLSKYAKKGATCLENPDACHDSDYESEEDKFIRNANSPKYTEKVRSDYERLKIENLMREMNRNNDLEPQKFRGYKDFSSMNTESDTPSNDEIVAAMRTLQKAGLYNSSPASISDLTMYGANPSQDTLMNLMGSSRLSPEVIQAMLTNNMSLGF